MNSKIILVTGGSSGIGKATALLLSNANTHIVLQARNTDKLKQVKAEIEAKGFQVTTYSTDLTKADEVQTTANTIIQEVGLPDVVINSAGAGEWLSIQEASINYFKESMDSPYLATAFTCKVWLDKMQERGTGHFIIVNSGASYFSFPGASGYMPARWAMLAFSRALQADLYYTKFKVSMVAFGKVASPYFTNNPRSESRIPKIASWLMPTQSTEQAGKAIQQVVKRPRNVVNKPFMLTVMVFINRLIPGVFRWFMRMTSSDK